MEIRSKVVECEVEYQVDLTIDTLIELLGLRVAPSIPGEFHWATQDHSSLNLDVGLHEVIIADSIITFYYFVFLTQYVLG